MSVINTMLLKLEARGAPAAVAGNEAVESAAAPLPTMPARRSGSSTSWRLPLLMVGGLALIGLTAFADWPKLMAKAPPAVAAAAPQAADAPVAPADAAPVATASETASETAAAPTAAAPTPVQATAPAATPVAATPVAATPPAPATRVAALAPALVPAAPAAATESAAGIPVPASLAPPLAMPSRIEKRSVAPSAAQQALIHYREATTQAQAGQRRPALEQAHAALAIDPRHAPSRLLAALLEHETGASQRAVQLLRDGLALTPGDTAQALLLARVLVAQGANTEALATLDQHGVAGADADGLRGGILAQQGDFRRSLAAYESAARQQPGQAMWWFGLAVALDSEGQAPRARQAYARAQAIGLPRDDLSAYASQRLGALD